MGHELGEVFADKLMPYFNDCCSRSSHSWLQHNQWPWLSMSLAYLEQWLFSPLDPVAFFFKLFFKNKYFSQPNCSSPAAVSRSWPPISLSGGQIPPCRIPVIQAFDFSQQGTISANEVYLCNEISSSSHRDTEQSYRERALKWKAMPGKI